MPPRAISAISWYFPSIRPGSVNIAGSVLPGCAEPEELLVGTRTWADLRSLAVTSRLFSFAMARFLAGRLDRAGRGHMCHRSRRDGRPRGAREERADRVPRSLVRHHGGRHDGRGCAV